MDWGRIPGKPSERGKPLLSADLESRKQLAQELGAALAD